jgi:hypothetical protein
LLDEDAHTCLADLFRDQMALRRASKRQPDGVPFDGLDLLLEHEQTRNNVRTFRINYERDFAL